MLSEIPKRGHSKGGWTQKGAKARKRAQMSAEERKCKGTKGRKRAQKGAKRAKERFSVKHAYLMGLIQLEVHKISLLMASFVHQLRKHWCS